MENRIITKMPHKEKNSLVVIEVFILSRCTLELLLQKVFSRYCEMICKNIEINILIDVFVWSLGNSVFVTVKACICYWLERIKNLRDYCKY